MHRRRITLIVVLIAALAAFLWLLAGGQTAKLPESALIGPSPKISEPSPEGIPTIAIAKPVPWETARPTPAAGLAVASFADGLDHPRWLHVLPNGDVLVAESNSPPREVGGITGLVMGLLMKRAGADAPSANRISLLRDADGDGQAEARSTLIDGLNSPFGMALIGPWLYIANTDAVVRVPFNPGQTRIEREPELVVRLPGGQNHWTRSLVASPDGKMLYVGVGSASNIAERGLALEEGRAAVWEIDLATRRHRLYAYGLRNPIGLAFEPTTAMLWTVVNERDMLGPDLVPDYLTSVQFGGFYGWPWYYWGGYVDKRVPDPAEDNRDYVIRPDYALGAHTAPLGLAFVNDARLGPDFAEGAFISRHGSWNRKPLAGYDVVFVPFVKGRPDGRPLPVLTSFLDKEGRARGRPVGVAVDGRGGLLVADDVGNRIWRVSAAKSADPGP